MVLRGGLRGRVGRRRTCLKRVAPYVVERPSSLVWVSWRLEAGGWLAWRMVGQRAVAARVAGSRPRRTLAGPAERARRPATGKVSPPPAARVPVVRVKARGLAAVVPREPPRDQRRGLRRPTGRAARAGRAARLPPKALAGTATPAARHRVTSRAAARLLGMVKGNAGQRARRARARREQARLTAGHARAGALREPLPVAMSGAAAGRPPAARMEPPMSAVGVLTTAA
jgi:hypothetical protein